MASKPPSDRDDAEKQFFVMFLKLRVPFFADFDKKALKVVMERMLCQDYKRGSIISKYKEEAENMYIVISGEVQQYDGRHHYELEGLEPDRRCQELESWGEEAMTSDLQWEATSKALRKTLVLTLQRRDLIEVLSHVKVMQQSDKQSFLIKAQFLDELTYNRVLEFNNLLQEQRFNPGEIVYDQGAESDTFFVAKRGKLCIQAIVEIEDRNIYPESSE